MKISIGKIKKRKLLWFTAFAVLVGSVSGIIIVGSDSSARNTDDGNPNQMIFGVDPFDQEYATGYIALGDAKLTRICGPGAGGPGRSRCRPSGGSATSKSEAVKRGHYVIYQFAGIKLNEETNLTEQYDALEYIWAIPGSQDDWKINIEPRGGWYGGSITGEYSAFLREWHFYKVDYEEKDGKVVPVHHLNTCLKAGDCDKYEAEFAGVMRMDDFDGHENNLEGYAFPQGVEPWGVWVARTNRTSGATGIAVAQKAYKINGQTVLANYWYGKPTLGQTSAATDLAAIWVEFKNSRDESGKIIPTQMIYTMDSSRTSSNSSDLVGVAFCVKGSLPESVQQQTNMYRKGTGMQEEDPDYSTYIKDPDSESWGTDTDGQVPIAPETEEGTGDAFIIGGGTTTQKPGICTEDPSQCAAKTQNMYSAQAMINRCHDSGYEAYSVFGITKYGALDPDIYMFNIDGYTFSGWSTSNGVKVSDNIYNRDGGGVMQTASQNIYYGTFTYASRQEVSDSACYSD